MNAEKESTASPSSDDIQDSSALENQKLRLEIEKLQDEIGSQRLPWWRKPVYIAAIFPTVLALVGATAAFVTGYVQTQYQLVQYQKEQLKTDREKYESEKEKLAINKTSLAGDLAQYEAEKQKLETKIAEMEKARQISTPVTYLDAIQAHAEQLSQATDPERELIELLKKDQGRRIASEVQGRLEHASDAAMQVHLMTILYLGTGDTKWFDQIRTLTQKSAESVTSDYWRVFGIFFSWPEKDAVPVIELLTDALKANPQLRVESQIFNAIENRIPYRWQRGFVNLRPFFSNNDKFFDAIKIPRDAALSMTTEWFYRSPALQALERLAPPVAVVIGSQIIDSEKNIEVLSFVNSALLGISAKPLQVRLKYPDSIEREKWSSWRQANRALISEATESNLDTWRKAPEKYDQLFSIQSATNEPANE